MQRRADPEERSVMKLPPERIRLIDEGGALKAALNKEDIAHDAATATRRARLEFIRLSIPTWFPKQRAAEAVSVSGNKYMAVVSERGNKSSIIDIAKVIARLGKEEAIKWVSIPLGELRKLLPKHEHAKFIAKERIGERSVEFVPKAKAKAA